MIPQEIKKNNNRVKFPALDRFNPNNDFWN